MRFRQFIIVLLFSLIVSFFQACRPRCPITSCRVKMIHTHQMIGGKLVRGSKWHQKQNAKYGEKHRKGAKANISGTANKRKPPKVKKKRGKKAKCVE
ncbi:hypothetical protein AAG747_20340 [Rapidithrix thailandica]|uniref:Secreted protein n=1 Tax=Rapidithrix thailandica TaxID=413964 RepID=A0AAW9SET7_9BACT